MLFKMFDVMVAEVEVYLYIFQMFLNPKQFVPAPYLSHPLKLYLLKLLYLMDLLH